MKIIREMINSNNTDKEIRYTIIADVSGVKVTVTAPMMQGREEARQECIDQLPVT